MAHQALYREFRPQRFADVVGQQHITRTLMNALKQKRIHHAYLLSGPRGTGKTTVARLIAKAVNCLDSHEGEPCNQCSSCRAILSGETMDVIEIDAASNRGIDEIRDLRDKVKYAPADLTFKVYIIDEVHMLSEPAFNALLKTLEEPPGHVLFVLATTEKQKLPVTIVSRCQSFEYHRLSSQEIVDRLGEVCQAYKVGITAEALVAIARQAEGGMRDALSLLDQVMAYVAEAQITLDDTLHVLGSAPLDQFLNLDSLLVQGDVGSVLLLLDELVRQGKDLRQLVRDYLGHLRDLLLIKVSSGGPLVDLPSSALEAVRSRASLLGQTQILGAIKLFAQLETDMRFSASPRLLVEVALIRVGGLFSPESHQSAEQTSPLPAETATRAAPRVTVAVLPAVKEYALPVKPAQDQATSVPVPDAVSPVPQAPTEAPSAAAQAWEQVVDLVKKARPSTHALITGARIGPVRGNTITLITTNAALVNLLKRPLDMGILQKAFARAGLEGCEIEPIGPEHPMAKADPGTSVGPGGDTSATSRSLLDIARSVFPKDLVHEVKEEGST